MARKGFTMIETLVVIVIIGMILGFAVPRFNSRQAKFNSTVNNIIDQLNMARQEAATKNITTTFYLSKDSFQYGNNVYRFPSRVFTYDFINEQEFSFDSPIEFMPGGKTDAVYAIQVIDSATSRQSMIYIFPSGYILKGTE
ncbi:MAG: type II secretion system protein [candidate division WOR-3 bacterium]|jgi:prepilin-type N-terminal cleavage/methylation domain-containing protein